MIRVCRDDAGRTWPVSSVALADKRGSVNQNVEPCPSSLSTPIRPPRPRTIPRLIASPRPVPPKRRLVDDRQMFELITTIAAYNMVSRVLVAIQVLPE